MKPITRDQAAAELQEQLDRFEGNIQNIANAVRRDHVIPFCKKKQARFLVGQGTYDFFTLNGGARVWEPDELQEILSLEVTHTQCLFQYMDNYPEFDGDEG